ncbi:hypothetical protein AB0I60_17920 [Actinosynnema sp. NPDC050436]|uniref:hypothetical protein n=1 Tax=Actinosynnema sp. NPDC050436 TaxID=3155659 RepID=UPI0033D79577
MNRSEWWLEALGKIVLWRLAEVGRPQRLEQIKRSLVDDLGVTVEPRQFADVIERLKRAGSLLTGGAGGCSLSENSRRALWKQREEAAELEEKISGMFAKSLAQAGCVLSPGEIFADFQNLLLNPLIRQLGARTHAILAGLDEEIEKAGLIHRLLERVDEDQRGAVRSAITDFLDTENDHVRTWVLGRLHAQLLVLAANLDRQSLDAVAPQHGGKVRFKVLLDTNLLFSILSLHANPSNEATLYLFDLLKEIEDRVEVQFLVLPQTISEATNALLVNRRSVGSGLITPELATATLRSGTQPGLVAHFLEVVEQTGRPMTAEVYFSPYLNGLEIILADKGIAVVDDPLTQVIGERQSVQSEIADIVAREGAKDRGRPRGSVVHDVVLWRYTAEKRKRTSIVAEMEYWGLSIDNTGLLRYDKDRRRAKRQAPCFLHPSQFIQMLQFWVPRNDKLEAALLSSARLPFMFQEFDPKTEQVTLRIISQLAHYSAISTDTALKVLQNEALREKVASDVAESQVVVAIDTALTEVVRNLETENQERESEIQRLNAEKSDLQRLVDRRVGVQEGRDTSKRQSRQQVQRAQAEAAKWKKQFQDEQERAREKEEKLSLLEEEQKDLRERLEEAAVVSSRRFFLGSAVAVAAACVVAVVLLWGPVVGVVEKGLPWKGALLVLVAAGVWSALCHALALRFSKNDDSWWVYARAKSLYVNLFTAMLGGVVGTVIQFSAAPPA